LSAPIGAGRRGNLCRAARAIGIKNSRVRLLSKFASRLDRFARQIGIGRRPVL